MACLVAHPTSADHSSRLSRRLRRGEQSLLYLNRRGTLAWCCAKIAAGRPPARTGVPLTSHGDRHELRCHGKPARASTRQLSSLRPSQRDFRNRGYQGHLTEVERCFPRPGWPGLIATTCAPTLQQPTRPPGPATSTFWSAPSCWPGVGSAAPCAGLLADASLYLPFFGPGAHFPANQPGVGRIGGSMWPATPSSRPITPDQPILLDAISNNSKNFYNNELVSRQRSCFHRFAIC